jgi:archaellum biogenesis ATPase FlaH
MKFGYGIDYISLFHQRFVYTLKNKKTRFYYYNSEKMLYGLFGEMYSFTYTIVITINAINAIIEKVYGFNTDTLGLE